MLPNWQTNRDDICKVNIAFGNFTTLLKKRHCSFSTVIYAALYRLPCVVNLLSDVSHIVSLNYCATREIFAFRHR